MSELATFSKHGDVGIVTLNSPPVNALSHELRLVLRDAFNAALKDPGVAAILLRCDGRTFVAGADIREFDLPPASPDVHEIVEWVAQCSKPVTAALHGTALGGGVELALACQFRVAAPDAQMGFPEVNLGILPGAGGTQRLPRLIGVRPALDLVVGGQPIAAPKALQLGLIDEVITGDLLKGAVAFVERMLGERRGLNKLSERVIALDEPHVFAEYEARLAQTHRGFLAPLRCVKAIRAAVELPFHEGLELERELFLELVHSPQSKAQRHAFFGEREVSRSPRLPRELRAREVRSVAVVGNGEAAVNMVRRFSDRRVPVTLLTVPRQQSGQTTEQSALAHVRVASGFEDLKDADVVVITLSGGLLAEVLSQLDAACSAEAVFAIARPDVNLRQAAALTRQPDRILGLNFEGPTLLEVIAPQTTGLAACATAMGLSKALRKVAVLEQAEEGSASGRLRLACLQAASAMADEGTSPSTINSALSNLGLIRLDASSGQEVQPSNGAGTELDSDVIRDRCIAALANEGARLLEESVVSRPLEVDMVTIHGHGFPLYLGGPLFHSDRVGVQKIYQTLVSNVGSNRRQLSQPAQLVLKLSQEGGSFYS